MQWRLPTMFLALCSSFSFHSYASSLSLSRARTANFTPTSLRSSFELLIAIRDKQRGQKKTKKNQRLRWKLFDSILVVVGVVFFFFFISSFVVVWPVVVAVENSEECVRSIHSAPCGGKVGGRWRVPWKSVTVQVCQTRSHRAGIQNEQSNTLNE